MSLNFSEIYPWSDIKEVTVDGQKMVRIPKFYLHTGVLPETSKYAGKVARFISGRKKPGFHIHPAFVKNHKEIPYFDFASYEAYNVENGKPGSAAGKSPRLNITFQDAITACTTRNTGTGEQAGWHLVNFYEHGAIALLLLIELGHPDAQAAIGNGNVSSGGAAATGSTDAVYRGIHEFWGNIDEWRDGLKTGDARQIQIFKNTMDGTYVDTGVVVPASTRTPIQSVSIAKGEGYDLGDVFIPTAIGEGSFGKDGLWSSPNAACDVSGYWADSAFAGPFLLGVHYPATSSSQSFGFRLARTPEA